MNACHVPTAAQTSNQVVCPVAGGKITIGLESRWWFVVFSVVRTADATASAVEAKFDAPTRFAPQTSRDSFDAIK